MRRTLMYLRSALASPPTVRAPHTRMLSLKTRMQFTPFGLSPSWSALLSGCATPSAPRMASLAGRLEHAALGVDARVDAGEVSARRHVEPTIGIGLLQLGARIEHLDPRVVPRGQVGPLRHHAGGGIGSDAGQRGEIGDRLRTVEDGEAIGGRGAMRHDLVAHRLGQHAGRTHQRDLVDRRECRQHRIEVGLSGDARHVAAAAAVVEEAVDRMREVAIAGIDRGRAGGGRLGLDRPPDRRTRA